MGVFDAEPGDNFGLNELLDWLIAAGDDKLDTEEPVLPEPQESELKYDEWLKQARSNGSDPERVAARLVVAWSEGRYPEQTIRPEQTNREVLQNHLTTWREWALMYRIWLRRSLLDPATPEQVAETVLLLAEVLDQPVPEKTAGFIVELFTRAALPVLVVRKVCERVAMIEHGKIKPASFSKLIETAKDKLEQLRRLRRDAAEFVEHLDAALPIAEERVTAEYVKDNPLEPEPEVVVPLEASRARRRSGAR